MVVETFAIAAVILVTGALITISAITILNTFTFPRLTPSPPDPLSHASGERGSRYLAPIKDDFFYPPLPEGEGQGVRVSLLIPARNEGAVIGETIRAALAHADPSLEVLLLDDDSTDNTGDLALAAAGGDPRFRLISGEALPNGWLGKNWACWQLAQAARGEILIFADADVRWSHGGLPAVLHEMERGRADMLTIWSTQITVSWGERLVVPLMALVILGYLPAPLVNNTRWAMFAAANGQCLVFRRAAYDKTGGHQAVCDQIVEDIQLAKRAKQAGLRFRMADGSNLVRCRMYHGWAQVRDGYAKNIIAGYGGISGLLLGTAFHWLVFLAPCLWLLFGWTPTVRVIFAPFAYPAFPLALISIGMLVRALTAAVTRQRVADAVFMPVSALLMTVITLRALYWRSRQGGVQWKGRVIKGS